MKRTSVLDAIGVYTSRGDKEPGGTPPVIPRPAARKSGVAVKRNSRTTEQQKSRKQQPIVKTTFALTFSDMELLRAEQTRRRVASGGRLRGQGIELSALVREAIVKTYTKSR